jgi:hypothetical protein
MQFFECNNLIRRSQNSSTVLNNSSTYLLDDCIQQIANLSAKLRQSASNFLKYPILWKTCSRWLSLGTAKYVDVNETSSWISNRQNQRPNEESRSTLGRMSVLLPPVLVDAGPGEVSIPACGQIAWVFAVTLVKSYPWIPRILQRTCPRTVSLALRPVGVCHPRQLRSQIIRGRRVLVTLQLELSLDRLHGDALIARTLST